MTNSEAEKPKNDESQSLEQKVAALEKRPDLFVRETRSYSRGEQFPGDIEAALAFRDVELSRLAELGINIPGNHTLGVTEKDGRAVAVESSDRILGDELDLALCNKDSKLSSASLTQHYRGLVAYMKESYQNGGFFLSDITRNNQQSMLGHTASDQEDRIYLIDLEPVVENFHKDELDHANNEHFFRSLDLLESTVKFASTFGQDVEAVMAEVQAFRSSIPENIHTRA